MSKLLMKVAAVVLSLLLMAGIVGCSNSGQPTVEDPAESGIAEKEASMKPVELKFAHFFSAIHPVETKLAGHMELLSQRNSGYYPGGKRKNI